MRSTEPDPTVSVVVPLLDEQECLDELYTRLSAAVRPLGLEYELLFVDDGSTDRTPEILARLGRLDGSVRVLTLSRNFGHQAAISAGLDHARGDAVIVLDGDLQDPPERIPDLVACWRRGFDVVYAVRRSRREGFARRFAYSAFYRLQRRLGGLELPLDSGDFGLMDRRVVRAIRELPERARFVRGLRSFVGFRQIGLEYDRESRARGRAKYSLPRLITLALDGLISFSSAPLRLATVLGLATAAVALGLLGWALVDALTHQTAPRGWASLIAVVLFMGAVQLFCVGVIGEYVRLIFLESKGRPTYILDPDRSTAVASKLHAWPGFEGPRRRSGTA